MTGPSGFQANWTSGQIVAGSSQDVTVRFSPQEEKTYSGTLTVNGDQTSGTNTMSISGTGARPPGPRTQFGPGQWRVGIDILAGRYYDDPVSGCYWERQSGLGGSFEEIIANEFIADNAGQWIVDIAPSDKAFETESECGTWYSTPRRGLQPTITSGVWLVGSQVNVGTYRSDVAYGCYWERMRSFTGELQDIIDNDFVSTAGQKFIEIRAGDLGFKTDSACGTWTPVVNAAQMHALIGGSPSLSRIKVNREMQRQETASRRHR